MKNRNKTNYIMLGIVMIAIIAAILYVQSIANNENSPAERKELSTGDDTQRAAEKARRYPKAVELVAPDGYLNTEEITIEENIGKKVILVDFWTYSCINCQRTIPYLNSWWEKYKDKGLIIIGVHTPEFDFEKDYGNVQKAIEKFGIKYPVVQDNEFRTWRAFGNRYWPRKYLIDIDGFIVYDHIGEGAYDETEKKVQELLSERNFALEMNEEIDKALVNPEADNPSFFLIQTPEIYFGYEFSRQQLGNKEGWVPEETVSYKFPEDIQKNKFYLEGEFHNGKDGMKVISDTGKIKLIYNAKNVNIVAGADEPVEISVYLDGKEHKKLEISGYDLYNIASMDTYGEHTVEIVSPAGLVAFTFTFG